MKRRIYAVSSIGMVIVLEFLIGIGWKYLKESDKSIEVSGYDMRYFIFAIASAVILTVITSACLKKIARFECSQSGKRELIFEILTYLVIAYMYTKIFMRTVQVADAGAYYMPWHSGHVTELVVMVLFGISVLQCRLIMNNRKEYERTFLFPWYLFLSGLSVYSLYQPNCFTSFYNMYHSHAYFNSVYRVLHLQPYNQVNTGVYGFYGIILAPVMRVFGTDFKACIIALLLLTFISILCYFYVLDSLTNSAIIKILASICVITPMIALSSSIYLQLWPHRIIFIGYMLAFIVWKGKYNNVHKRYRVMGYIIMVCSVIWNFETGIACVLAYFGSEIVCILQNFPFKDFTAWIKVLWNIIQILLVVVCAWMLVGGYNLMVAHTFLPIKVFLFPFYDNTYVYDLDVSLSTFPSAWMLVLALIVISIGTVVLSTNLCGNQYKSQKLIYLAACTIGVSIQMMYFVNRSVYGNLYIVLPIVSLIMVFWVDYFKDIVIWTTNNFCNGCFRAICVVLISTMILISLMSVSRYYPLEMAKVSGRSEEGIENMKAMVLENVPKDTLGIGVGIPEIYSYLGWDTGFYGIDMADFGVLPDESKLIVYEIVNNANDLFTNIATLTQLNENGMIIDFYESHDLVASFVYAETEFGYYSRKEG